MKETLHSKIMQISDNDNEAKKFINDKAKREIIYNEDEKEIIHNEVDKERVDGSTTMSRRRSLTMWS